MNERIKELMVKCNYVVDGTCDISREQKFAELIVQECVEQVWYTREDGINGNVSEVIKDRIKEHFGVEE